MRLLVPAPLVVGIRALGLGTPGRGCLRVMAMWQPSGGDNARDGKLLDQEAFWETVQDDCLSFDDGFPKLRGEFLLSGCASSEAPVTDLGVMVTVGPAKKLLHVFGERFWSGSKASTPTTFTEMPITWERALGGPKDHHNFVGRGEVEDEKIGAVLLPNIELPHALVRGPKDRPPPAGYGARAPAELPRRDWLGTMDDRWIDTRFPEMPLDFNPRYGQQACDDQWAPGFWQGDEDFSLLNLRPGMPRWEGRLPGLRARAWVRRVQRPEPEEAQLVLDTVWFFPRHGRIALIWRGLFELEDDDELNVKEVMAALEWMGEVRPDEHYAIAGAQRRPNAGDRMEPESDADLLPPELAPETPPDTAEAQQVPPPDAPSILEQMRTDVVAELEAVQADLRKQRDHLAAQGQPTKDIDQVIAAADPEKAWQKMEAAAKGADEPADIEAILAQTRQELVAAGASADRIAEFDVTAAEAKVQNAQLDAELSSSSRGAVGPPELPTAEEQVDVLAMLRGLKEQAGTHYPAGIEAQIAALEIPQFRNDLATQENAVRERYRASAHLQEALMRLGPESSAKRRADVEQAIKAGESLRRWDLTALDLSAIDLHGADLSEAWLESANLGGANLSGCNLARAVLTRANLTKADLSDADLTDANLGGVVASDADLARAKLGGAICAKACFTGASLAEASLSEVDLSDAKLERVSFRRCNAALLTMRDTDLSDCDFREAELVAADFVGCTVHRANFAGAKLERTLFFACQGNDVNFSGALAFNMRFGRGESDNEQSSFPRANFRDATLTNACLGDTCLKEADFRGSTANQSIFSSSDLTGARFDGVPLQQARFERAILRDASFVCADLMEAHLMRARVQGTSFEHANLFGINTLRMRLDEHTNFRDANLEGVRFFQPIKEVPAGPNQ